MVPILIAMLSEGIVYLHVFLVILHDPSFQVVVLMRDELIGGEICMVGIVLANKVATFS